MQIKSVEFNYPTKADVPVLKGIDLNVDNNQIVALVGHSGSGKSSIICLIERFYDPKSGQLLFNGDDLQNLDMCWYHQQKLAIVQQEPALFSTTIKENILYGFDKQGMTDKQVTEKLEMVIDQASCQFVRDKELFPDGVDTVVGEKGKTLSGG